MNLNLGSIIKKKWSKGQNKCDMGECWQSLFSQSPRALHGGVEMSSLAGSHPQLYSCQQSLGWELCSCKDCMRSSPKANAVNLATLWSTWWLPARWTGQELKAKEHNTELWWDGQLWIRIPITHLLCSQRETVPCMDVCVLTVIKVTGLSGVKQSSVSCRTYHRFWSILCCLLSRCPCCHRTPWACPCCNHTFVSSIPQWWWREQFNQSLNIKRCFRTTFVRI